MRILVLILCTSAAVLCTRAQTVTPAPATAAAGTSGEEALVLSPFTVDATSDVGYAATSTLGGTRLKSELRDVAS